VKRNDFILNVLLSALDRVGSMHSSQWWGKGGNFGSLLALLFPLVAAGVGDVAVVLDKDKTEVELEDELEDGDFGSSPLKDASVSASAVEE
jgi:hypothetical protein